RIFRCGRGKSPAAGIPLRRVGRGWGMKGVELYGRVRYAVQIEGLSHRAAARRFGIDPRTVAKMMKFTTPTGYVRTKPPAKPKLDPVIPVIDRILFGDKSRPRKQQHTAKRIVERLRDEYGFASGHTDCEGLRRRLASAGSRDVCTVHAVPPEAVRLRARPARRLSTAC